MEWGNNRMELLREIQMDYRDIDRDWSTSIDIMQLLLMLIKRLLKINGLRKELVVSSWA